MHLFTRCACYGVSIRMLLAWLPAQDQSSSAPKCERCMLGPVVQLVLLNATLVDHRNQPVSDLKANDVAIYEDGKPQRLRAYSVEESPVSMGIVVDSSRSMANKQDAMSRAVAALLEASNPEDDLFLVNFNDVPRLDQDFTHDHNLIAKAVMRSGTHHGTALYDAVVFSLEHLARHTTRTRTVLVLITDGENNESHISLKQAVQKAQGLNGTSVYSIGVPSDQPSPELGRTALKALSKATGALAIFPKSESAFAEAGEQVARDIRGQFYLGYTPSNPLANGGCRKVKVVAHVSGKELIARTLSAYCVPRQDAANR